MRNTNALKYNVLLIFCWDNQESWT